MYTHFLGYMYTCGYMVEVFLHISADPPADHVAAAHGVKGVQLPSDHFPHGIVVPETDGFWFTYPDMHAVCIPHTYLISI